MTSYKKEYKVIGLMSGTSFDGLDIALCHFILEKNQWSFQIEKAETIAYSIEWIKTLQDAEKPNSNYQEISRKYGLYIGEEVNLFIKRFAITGIDLIASHGHTLFHEPAKKLSFQAGDGDSIFNKTSITTVSNFRQQDVLLGGQGAPLVPIGDLLLFKKHTVCVNLGGFANISLKANNTITAWDICPVNYILNNLTLKIGLEYDDKGKIAALNTIDEELLQQLNDLSYYNSKPPKSLSREWVFTEVWPLLNNSSYSIEQKIATIAEHAAIQIAQSIPKNSTALFTGGGTFNTHLMNRIKLHNDSLEITVPEKKIIEFKEALIFAFLGTLRIRDENNVLASVTGAIKDHSSGEIFSD